jgi:transcription elongation factor S-II
MNQLRLEKFKELYEVFDEVEHTILIEAYAFDSALKIGSLHEVPVWAYSNGAMLFETDRPEAHEKEKMSSYVDKIEEIKALCVSKDFRDSIRKDPCSIETLEFLAENTEFGRWQKSHLDSINKSKAILEERSEGPSNFIKCGKCKSGDVDTEQKQTRSADEPMTIFCLCRKCGNRFTMQ